MTKKSILVIGLIILIAILLFLGIIYIGNKMNNKKEIDNDKVEIVATLFPQYDFAKQIGKDKVNVVMLLEPGVESHSYEPTPSDIITISESDLFIYTGQYMETWAQNIIDGLDSNVNVLDVSTGIELISEEVIEEERDHLALEEEEELDHSGHNHTYDPHIWTNPIYAIKMCENILEELCKVDPENSDYYRENAEKYISSLKGIDEEIRDIVANAKRTTIISGSRFPFYYFVCEYGLEYISAYDSCSTEAEPSTRVVADLINIVKENNYPVVYYQELVDPNIARTITEQAGAKMLLLHSAHNVSKEDFNNGITYIDIMKNNIENLKEGLY